MYRGTTPTITINCDIDVSEFVTMWVTFRTQQLATYAPPKQVEVTKHLGDEGVDATDPDPTSRSLLHHRAPVRRAGPALLLLQAGGRRHRHSGQDLRRQQRPRHNQRRGGEILRQATDTRGHTSGPM